MHPNEKLIHSFYEAFGRKDYRTMQDAYDSGAAFNDPVFQNLSASEVRAMWKMLALSAKDLSINISGVTADDTEGRCRWEAWYTFSATGRRVHNVVDATFQFQEGKIINHRDNFDFWRWSRMALGTTGLFLGWTPYLSRTVRHKARMSLSKFMKEAN